ncbi:MAG: hypothetical protein QRY74_00745 [Chlamydia sp.]
MRADENQIFGVTKGALSHWLLRTKQRDLAPQLHGSNPSKIDNQKLRVGSHVEKLKTVSNAIDCSLLSLLQGITNFKPL